MLKCPNHELPGNIIIDNFYARLSFQDKTLLDTTCSGSFTSNKEEFKRDLLDRIKENAEDWENDKGKESGYADKPPFKPLPPKEGNEEKEKKKKKGTKKKKKKKENKKKEVTAYPRVNEITLGNRKYVAPNDYYDNESEYDDLPIPFTHISDHDLDEHAAFDIENLFGTDYEINDDSIIHVPLNDDIESSKLGDVVLEDPVFETSTFSENDDITYSGLLERDIFDLFLPEFDKPWVIHLRETCCCSTNLCSWRPNTVYKNRSTRRHHQARRPTTTRAPPHRRVDAAHQPRAAALASRAPTEEETRISLSYLRPPAVGARGLHSVAASVKTIPARRSSTYTPRGGESSYPRCPFTGNAREARRRLWGEEEGGDGRGAAAARG
ncbi:hypothetical protein QYE76_032897 [Lolium multiflorum]|uniref:Uncharacterized protein n=1 Tax=Lolium multiflorum TaxID=4521 RepID=A0AAD8QXR2_LOLMU|nr:hypothetical protein QYE76_032897 [Lolium multiflorum]